MVDGGSRDAIVARAAAAGARADATVLAFVDGDGSDRVELAGEVVGSVLAGSADLVLGFRFRGPHEPGRSPAASARHRSRAGARPAHLRDAGRRPVPGRRRVRDVGSDMGQMAPMSGARAAACGTRPGEHVADGGYAKFADLAE